MMADKRSALRKQPAKPTNNASLEKEFKGGHLLHCLVPSPLPHSPVPVPSIAFCPPCPCLTFCAPSASVRTCMLCALAVVSAR